jgi:ADP-ribosylglycohydrolase
MGAVLGAFIGDAAGGVLEFWHRGKLTEADIDEALRLNGGGAL